MTWSIVEQGIGIVCACLPTLRPVVSCMYTRRSKNHSKEGGSSSIGMEHFHPGTAHSEKTTPGKSAFQPATYESESTVGFARLHDEESAMSPADVQRSVYAATPAGAAVSTTAGEGDRKSTKVVPSGILREQTMG